MSKRLPPLNALKAFESAARHLSFTKAAGELFVTQAAISHQIKTLESFLSTPLFHRKNRSLLLTDEGQAYFQDVRDIFSNIMDATDRVLALNEKGTITVATPPSFASQWLVPRIHLFSQHYSDIDVRIKAVDEDDGFLDERVDIAVYYGDGRWRDIDVLKLTTEFFTPVCSPMLLQGERPLSTLSDLSQHTLLHDNSREGWKNWLKTMSVKDVDFDKGPVFSHTMMVLQAASIGQGIALADSVLAKPDIDAGRLICPFEERIESKKSFYVVCRPEQSNKNKIQVFKDWLISEIEEQI
ncbi:MAG: transcriptional regulator GcvA [Pseudomonadota bacterium]